MTERRTTTVLETTRGRMVRHGSSQLTDTEVVAVLLAAGIRGRDPFELANELIVAAGGLQNLLRLDAAPINRIRGIGPAGVARLAAALELGRRHLEGSIDRRRSLTKPQDAAVFFRARLADLTYEVFGCLYLDTRHRLICFETLFRGTIDGATVYPREILKRALHHNAAAVIVGHNHPSNGKRA